MQVTAIGAVPRTAAGPAPSALVERRDVEAEKDWLQILKIMKLFLSFGEGLITDAKAKGRGRPSVFNYRVCGGHGDAGGREGRTPVAVGALLVRQAKTVKSMLYLDCPVWFSNWTENLFWSLQHQFWSIFKNSS